MLKGVKKIDKFCDWKLLSKNSNITWNIIKDNLDKPWDWKYLSSNSSITWDIIIDNINKPWDWNCITPHISYLDDDSMEILYIDLNKYNKNLSLSGNCNINMDIIKNNSDYSWNWYELSKLPFITLDFIENNLDKPWDWKSLSLNKNITFEIVINNMDKSWDWYKLSHNNMELGKKKWIKQNIKVEIKKKFSHKILSLFFDYYICNLICYYIQ